MNTVSKFDDVIDSRDVIARIEELTEERDDLVTALDEAREERNDAEELTEDEIAELDGAVTNAFDALKAWDDENAAELKALTELADQCEGYADDWKYGATLVRDSYFEDYAQELAEDIGAISKDVAWPYTCIDWGQAARELRMDYTQVDFNGVTYWVR